MERDARDQKGLPGAPRVLLVGDFRHRDFRDAESWLKTHTQLLVMDDMQAASTHLDATRRLPRLIVVAQSRPGQFSTRQIESLHRAAPLARLHCLLGSWAEGETRSGHPCPGVERVYWYESRARWAAMLAADLRGSRILPRTATSAERLLAAPAIREACGQGLVGIHSPTHGDYLALAETCQSWGHATAWLSPRLPVVVGGVKLLLWDGANGDATEAQRLQSLVAAVKPMATVVLLTFPRVEDHDRMLRAGAGSVLSKPFLNQELQQEFARLEGLSTAISHPSSNMSAA
ncbi:MAG: hypothetical protein RIC55_17965 [Pirellulaceae bacterium]